MRRWLAAAMPGMRGRRGGNRADSAANLQLAGSSAEHLRAVTWVAFVPRGRGHVSACRPRSRRPSAPALAVTDARRPHAARCPVRSPCGRPLSRPARHRRGAPRALRVEPGPNRRRAESVRVRCPAPRRCPGPRRPSLPGPVQPLPVVGDPSPAHGDPATVPALWPGRPSWTPPCRPPAGRRAPRSRGDTARARVRLPASLGPPARCSGVTLRGGCRGPRRAVGAG